jgi:ribonuclease T1
MTPRLRAFALAALACVLVAACASGPGTVTHTTTGTPAGEEGAAIAATLSLIEAGGPFPNRADGEVFENREGLLPDEPRGYYHSYTVETPGSDDRGARRLVTGAAGELFYTRDHYDSFERYEP